MVFARSSKGPAGSACRLPPAVDGRGPGQRRRHQVIPGDGDPPNTPTAANDNLGHGDVGRHGPRAILYVGLLTAVLLWILARLTINRTRRWYRLGAYVVGVGIGLILILWFCFENVILLLPQSI